MSTVSYCTSVSSLCMHQTALVTCSTSTPEPRSGFGCHSSGKNSTYTMPRSRFQVRGAAKEPGPKESAAPIVDAGPSGSSYEENSVASYRNKLWENMMAGELGKRGEQWVVAQFVLGALVLFPPSFVNEGLQFVGLGQPASCALPLPGVGTIVDLLLGPGALAGALGFLSFGVKDLGTNLTPMPKPTPDSELVTTGVYGLVRHPLYAGLVIASAAITKMSCSPSRLLFALALWQALERKVRCEEDFLVEKYGQAYLDYKKVVKKFVPFIY